MQRNINTIITWCHLQHYSNLVFSNWINGAWFMQHPIPKNKNYSWIPITRTLKENRKRFELSGAELLRVKLVRKWPEGETKKVRVSGRFELIYRGFNCNLKIKSWVIRNIMCRYNDMETRQIGASKLWMYFTVHCSITTWISSVFVVMPYILNLAILC